LAKQKVITTTTSVIEKWNNYRNKAFNKIRTFVISGNSTLVSPLIYTNWDQAPFYNDSCPHHSVTGCGNTTMAQIMKYWAYLPKGSGITPPYNSYSNGTSCTVPQVILNNISYDWTAM